MGRKCINFEEIHLLTYLLFSAALFHLTGTQQFSPLSRVPLKLHPSPYYKQVVALKE